MDAPTAIMLVLLVVLIFFIFRNRRKRQNEQAELQTKMVPGVELMLTFGIYGTLVSIDDAENIAEVEIAPGTIIKVHRQTLGRIVEPVVAEVPATETGIVGSSSDQPRYSLNKDTAITSNEPSFGERVDPNTDGTPSTGTDKS
jgi:preprotein translocase subunit YajC